ncbi:hypothetical protein SLE2022_116940 [Rubroshorea leprosula]
MKKKKEPDASHQSDHHKISTIEDALMSIPGSVQQVILDAKVGPPSYGKVLAKDILKVVSFHLLSLSFVSILLDFYSRKIFNFLLFSERVTIASSD